MSKYLKKLQGGGGRSGLNQTSNTMRMTAVITAPFIVGWIVLRMFVPPEFSDFGTVLFFIAWLAYVLILYANTKGKAASYIPFPQAHWFFPDGQQVNFDLMLPPKSWEELAVYQDGTALYRVYFKEKLEYQDTDRPYPDIFDRALWKLPAKWNDSFKRNGHGEFFFENLFVDHPACENIEVSVIEWDEQSSTRLPICVVTGCSWFYKEALESKGKKKLDPDKKTITDIQALEATIKDLKEENRELSTRNEFLEQEAEHYTTETPEDIKELADKRLEANRKRYGTIMDTKGSLWSRITNLKTLGILIVVLSLVLVLSHFWFGWP